MTVPDEEVFAFVDGELPPEDMARIEAAMASDPQLALRIETQRALRRLLSGAHAGVVRGSTPEGLGATAATSPPGPAKPAEVIAFPGAKNRGKAKTKDGAKAPRAPKPPRPEGATGRGVPPWIGLAACLILGLVVGRMAAPPPVTLSGADTPAPLAAGPLAEALNSRGSAKAAGPVRVGLSFQTPSGGYCRTFVASGRSPISGVACRDPDAWRVRAVSPTAPNRPNEIPGAILAAVESMRAGPLLDAAGEAKATAAGWKPQKGAAPR